MSDMSRAKFDFSGYNPDEFRKKKPKSPERPIIMKVEEDLEIFMTDTTKDPKAADFELKNAESADQARVHVVNEIFDDQLLEP